MRTAFLPFVLLLVSGGVALGQNPAMGAVKAKDQAQLRATATLQLQAALQARLRAQAEAEERAEERNLAQARVLEAQNGLAPLTLPGNPGQMERPEASGPEAIPTQWPNAKFELIPTRWHAQVILVGGGAARPATPLPGKDAGAPAVPK